MGKKYWYLFWILSWGHLIERACRGRRSVGQVWSGVVPERLVFRRIFLQSKVGISGSFFHWKIWQLGVTCFLGARHCQGAWGAMSRFGVRSSWPTGWRGGCQVPGDCDYDDDEDEEKEDEDAVDGDNDINDGADSDTCGKAGVMGLLPPQSIPALSMLPQEPVMEKLKIDIVIIFVSIHDW